MFFYFNKCCYMYMRGVTNETSFIQCVWRCTAQPVTITLLCCGKYPREPRSSDLRVDKILYITMAKARQKTLHNYLSDKIILVLSGGHILTGKGKISIWQVPDIEIHYSISKIFQPEYPWNNSKLFTFLTSIFPMFHTTNQNTIVACTDEWEARYQFTTMPMKPV